MTFAPLQSLEVLRRHDVAFVLIGGMAGNARGSSLVTNDIDICYQRTPQNLDRLAAALNELNARLRGAPEGVPFILDARSLRAGDHFTFETDAGDLDCLGTPAGTRGYEDLAARADAVDLEGFEVLVASLDDLIVMKDAAGRPKDLHAVMVLRALRALRDESAR